MIQKQSEQSDTSSWCEGSKWKVQVGSFREEKSMSRESRCSEPAFIIDKAQENEVHCNLMHFQQKHYYLIPELYSSFRNQHVVQQVKGHGFNIIKYSQGRIQMAFEHCIQAELPNIASLTLYANGDYRLVSNQTVHFWHQQNRVLEKYSVSI